MPRSKQQRFEGENAAWFGHWFEHLKQTGDSMTNAERDACARLAAVLLCGEQSAIQVFSAEIERNRQRGSERAVTDLVFIEQDEHQHELALSLFCDYLPNPVDQHRLKRRAQKFFAGVGRSRSLAEHFVRIAQLDTAVCKIMQHVEKAKGTNVHVLRQLAHRIKLDEARHVSVSRRYANNIGYDRRLEADQHHAFKLSLIDMLQPLAPSFEVIGVDSDQLFRNLLGA